MPDLRGAGEENDEEGRRGRRKERGGGGEGDGEGATGERRRGAKSFVARPRSIPSSRYPAM